MTEAKIAGEERSDDGTVKLLLEMSDGVRIETVIIPEASHTTLCVSTQAGCGRSCAFCATGRVKLKRNLTAGEIVDQVSIARRRAPVTNIVFMGMGEPLDNYENVRRAAILLTSPRAFGMGKRHVTLSTSGVAPNIVRLAEDRMPVHLTVSLNAPDDALRSRIMPVNRTWPIAALMASCREYTALTRQTVTFAYVLMSDINDAPAHAVRLASLARSIGAKVNLIPLNRTPDRVRPDCGPLERPSDDRIARFQSALKDRGVLALLRREHGSEIAAACGQLALA
jgi:23S rRNA (adenine2503-C2)-methyltransferase